MPIVSAPDELLDLDVYVSLSRLVRREVFLKCEGFNFGGSLKLRTAASMVAAAERDGKLGDGAKLIESSSGNLGVALSVIAAAKGISFTCVTDDRCNATTVALMRALGTDVLVLAEPHPEGGLLRARIDRVRELCAADPGFVWLNQYGNDANWIAHYEVTAPAIARRFPGLDVVFCGTGTGGTAMGCARYFRGHGQRTRVVAVDSVGSVNFGGPAGPRFIPGLGAGVRPALLDPALVDDVVHVHERDTIRMCRKLAANGMVFGGSTGTILRGALDWLDRHDPGGQLKSVVIAPDLGERYLSTVYDDEWVLRHFGPEALEPLPEGGHREPRVRCRAC